MKIPEVFIDATNENSNFILMEYIDGKKIYEINEEDYYSFSKVAYNKCSGKFDKSSFSF